MAVTYTYEILELSATPTLDELSNVINHARFKFTGVDENGASGSFMGACPIPAPDPENFTPSTELTEAQVIEWIKIAHPTDHMKERVQKQIDSQIIIKLSEDTLPWTQQ